MTLLLLLRNCIQHNKIILRHYRRRSCLSLFTHSGKPDDSRVKRWHQINIASGVSSKPTSTPISASTCVNTVDELILISHQDAGSHQIMKCLSAEWLETLTEISSWRNDVSTTKARIFLSERLQQCDLTQVGEIMRQFGRKKSRSRLHLILKPHLPAIASHLESFSSKLWSFDNIFSIIYGLQCFEEEDDGYLRILSLVTKIADKSFIKKGNPSFKEISAISIGLQRNKMKSTKSREFLSCLTSIVMQSKGTDRKSVV